MATIVRGNRVDREVQALKGALDAYEYEHPEAQVELYRHNPASIRLRVIDRHFMGMPKSQRHAEIWEYLAKRVSDDAMAELSVVLTLAPAELETSIMNAEFDKPTRFGV
jgi:hypothetical protein